MYKKWSYPWENVFFDLEEVEWGIIVANYFSRVRKNRVYQIAKKISKKVASSGLCDFFSEKRSYPWENTLWVGRSGMSKLYT